jgi:hypothetical protein
MSLTPRVIPAVLLGVLSIPVASWAQTIKNPPSVKPSRTAAGMEGTLVKKPPVMTDDAISLMAVRSPAKPAETSKFEIAAGPTTGQSAEVAQDLEKRKAEILALQQQIKEKQQRVELLMRMFVIDEHAFLMDPSGQSEDQEVRAKRKFEQAELLQQGKEIVRLKERLDAITLASGETAAAVKP